MCVGKALTGGYLTLAACLQRHVGSVITAANQGALHGPTFMANRSPAPSRPRRLTCSVIAAGQVALIESSLTESLAPAAGLGSVREVRVVGAVASSSSTSRRRSGGHSAL